MENWRWKQREMEVVEMLPMKGGVGDTSYANNSFFQQKIISMAWSITKEAIADLYCTTFPSCLAIADLGCSCGPNTLFLISNLIKEIEKIRQQLHKKKSLEYQIFFNDLYANDFNLLFRSLPNFQQNLKTQFGNNNNDFGPCFFTGVPGSFYTRLFPSTSLHFVFSSYSIHFLSQVPEGVESNNKGNIFISDTSPKAVIEAYQKQYQKDFSMFLKCRAEELVIGGRMVLISTVRTTEDRLNKEWCYTWELLNLALNNMVTQGIVDEEKVDSFNVPVYTPSLSEVKAEVLKEGSFNIQRLEVSKINWNVFDNGRLNVQHSNMAVGSDYNYAKCMRSGAEPLLVRHFGEAIIDELFQRYEEIIKDRMLKEEIGNFNFTISLTKIK